jgi:hypothetical protein
MIAAVMIVYAAGVALGIVCGNARPTVRIALALLWPLGLVAFAVTLLVLLAASLIAFPMFAALVAAIVLLWALM